MLTAQFFDFGTFVRMIGRHGPAAEANPIVAGLLDDYGVPLLFVAKVIVAVLVVAVVLIITDKHAERPRPRLAAAVLTAGIVAGLVGGLSNALTLI